MDLEAVGQLIAGRRRARGLTLRQLAAQASVGRSTLAALEAGKLTELGVTKLDRVCHVLDLALDVHPVLDAPLLPHRHLTERAGRELTRAAIDDVIVRGDVPAWRKLVRAARADGSGHIARRVRDVCDATAGADIKARAFARLFERMLRESDAGDVSA